MIEKKVQLVKHGSSGKKQNFKQNLLKIFLIIGEK